MNGSRMIEHFPNPVNNFSFFQFPRAFGEPEFCCDFWIYKGIENLRDWFSNQHGGFGKVAFDLHFINAFYCKIEIKMELQC